jgi:hypothetical protein
MTTDTDKQAPRPGTTGGVDLPAQRMPAEAPAPSVDHVRMHGRSCWWDLTECRWQCSPGS